MLQTVLKYKLKAAEWQVLNLPKGSIILSAHVQYEEICIWVLVTIPSGVDKEEYINDETNTEERIIEVYGTGNDIEHDDKIQLRFISTVLLRNGSLVFHVFERLVANQF